MTANIYDQHKAAFANVSAYVILDATGDRVATIAFKYPKDGAGRLYAYVHWFGLEMRRGYAGGGGYDKHSAACADAMPRLPVGAGGGNGDAYETFCKVLSKDDGHHWDSRLRDAGFTVLQAV
jgi:hypothetical protein